MTQESLLNYITTQVSNNQQLDYITTKLLQQGFSQQQINEAYTELGYFKSNHQTVSSSVIQDKKNTLFPSITVALVVVILLILGTGIFVINKNKNKLVTPLPSVTTLPTSQVAKPTDGITACSMFSRWSTTAGATFNATASIKTLSKSLCVYTDPLLSYTVQYPASWFLLFNQSHLAGKSPIQPYNIISFYTQQPTASTSSPQAVSILVTPSKTNSSDIISYMKSIQSGPGDSYQPRIEKNVYQPIIFAGKKAVQMQFTLGQNVGIDTKFISKGILYDISLNGTAQNAITANKQTYTNFLNSFTSH